MKTVSASSVLQHSVLTATLLLGITAFNQEGWTQEREGQMVGRQAPSFEIQGVFGETYALETFKGHILVMQFGSSW